MWLLRVTAALDHAKVPYALVGGFAVALHGVVRGTVDIDLVLRFRETDFTRADDAFRSIGLMPRLPVTASEVYRFRVEYIENRNVTAWTFVNAANPSEIVDVADLIRMKTKSGRPQDLEDVRALRSLK
jgi:hypothetical protein